MADKNTTSNINLAAAEELPKAQSKFKEFVKKFMKRKTAVISLAFIVFIILMAIIGPYVVPYDPQAPDYTAMMQGPSAAHIWGTNEYGQDVFSRLMVGTRLSLTCALTATIIGTAIGVVLGLIAALAALSALWQFRYAGADHRRIHAGNALHETGLILQCREVHVLS